MKGVVDNEKSFGCFIGSKVLATYINTYQDKSTDTEEKIDSVMEKGFKCCRLSNTDKH